ncbi:TetR/AcrR family transcriptional regulator [Actinopolymorpha sp. NPDC004070]|uniref:TetR/AcrR family transcriptional regulator n=1 Tax=Actinopolymorpha sp. NPDC004070 TaxID=3154548 RepID=UPI0033A08F73
MPVPKGSSIDPERTRAGIVDAATPLLYERGLDGIGVAELCTRLGVSKETLYRYFGSKEGLIEAVLAARSERVSTWIADAAAAAGDDPRDQITAVFDELQRWYEEPDFRGCAMQNAAAQHHVEAVRSITARHLDRRLDLLTDIARRAGADDPDALGRQLLLLVEGATLVAAHHDRAGAGGYAKRAALALLPATRPADRGSRRPA